MSSYPLRSSFVESIKQRESFVHQQNGLFTTAAIDNIDNTPASTTATDAFHGTSISIFQHQEEEQIEKVFTLDRKIDKMNIPLELPESFTAISPAKTLPSEYPLQQVCTQEIANENDNSGFLISETLTAL